MPDSMMWDVLLLLLLFPAGLLIALILGPIALGAGCRRANVPVPRFRRRAKICALSLLAGAPVLIVAMMLYPRMTLLWLPLVAILAAILVAVLRYGPEGFVLPHRHTWAPALVLMLAAVCMTVGPPTAMTKWRACAARTVGLSFLNSISKGLVLYRTDYGQSPDHLRRLETAGLVGGKERSVPTENDTRIFEQTEYTYFPLPDSAPGDLLRVFDWPVHHNDEGACVLYVNGQARWVPTAQFVVDLDKTYRWRLAQSAPAATSAE